MRIKRLGIKCDLASAPSFINAQTPDESLLLRKEQAARRAAGVVASWMTPAAAQSEAALESAPCLGAKPASNKGVMMTWDGPNISYRRAR